MQLEFVCPLRYQGAMSATRLAVTAVLLGTAFLFWRIESEDQRARQTEAAAKTSAPEPEPNFERKPAAPASRYQGLVDIAMTEGVRQAFGELESQLPNENPERVRERVAVAILGADFTKLAEVLAAMHSRTERNNVIAGSMQAAIRADKKGALDIVRSQLNGAERNNGLRYGVMELLGERMFSDARSVLAEIPPSDERRSALINIAGNLGRVSIVDALQWSDGLEETERTTACDWIKTELVDRKDVLGLKTFLERATDRMTRFSTIKSIISFGLERGDDAGVSAFIETLHDEEKVVGEQHRAMRLAQRDGN
jgi:hypothetical protein